MMRDLKDDRSDIAINDFNDANRLAGSEYDNGRFTNPISGTPGGLEGQLSRLLREAADLVDANPTNIEVMADVYCFLHNARRIMPKIEAWCCVKHYGTTDRTSGWYGKTAVWSAHVTKQAAEQAAVAARKRYGDLDPFVVERALADITQFERRSPLHLESVKP